MQKRTKIVCTIGPATEAEGLLGNLMKSGMNIARLNFSHGVHEDHGRLIKSIRKVARKNKKLIGIIADLQGPKIRLSALKDAIELKKGKAVVLTTGAPAKEKIGVTYGKLHKDLKRGHRILIDDGLVELVVEGIKGRDMHCKVINGGKVSSHKGMNFPDTQISLASLTEKDAADLYFAMQQKVNFIAISFVRSVKDVRQLKKLINRYSKKLRVLKPKVIAKIEKGEALENFIGILSEVDAVMVARGDLGIEIPAEDVPLRQKEIVALCRREAKPVIIATQMLDSMTRNPRPTRAEVSDVANSVMDNADAVMLSGETAMGKYPKETVEMMRRIIMETEESPYDDVDIKSGGGANKNDAIGKSVGILVRDAGIQQVVDLSDAGLYRYVSKWRPEAEIFACADEYNLYPLMFWGVEPVAGDKKDSKKIISRLRKDKKLKKKFILLTDEDKLDIVD